MNPHPYDALTPDLVLDAVESLGLRADGRLLAMNSYENRVYQVGLEDGTRIIAKFYRPGRWSDAAIAEEHAFAIELAQHEIPIVPPTAFSQQTLHHHPDFCEFRFALFPFARGRAPEFEQRETLEWMGRFLGRIHACGASQPFQHRPSLNPATFGHAPIARIEAGEFVPLALRPAHMAATAQAMQAIEAAFARVGPIQAIRLHGDCHAGNVLWNDGPVFVDLDDCISGPAIQDLWMLLSGDRNAQQNQLIDVLTGYEDFAAFDTRQLQLIEPLRTLRLIHFSGWIAQRWSDPAFPRAFPWFGTERYWQDRILELREQIALMSEPPLNV